MGFWDTLGSILGRSGSAGLGYPTSDGSQFPGGTQFPQGQQPQGNGVASIARPLIGAGAAITSQLLQQRAANQNNARLQQRTAMLDQLAKDEASRREYYTTLLLPNILRGLGQKNPSVVSGVSSRLNALPQQGPPQAQYNTAATQSAAPTPPSTPAVMIGGPSQPGGGIDPFMRGSIDPTDPNYWNQGM